MLQTFKSYLKRLNFLVTIADADRLAKTGESHNFFTQYIKPGISTQKFSNLKILATGSVVLVDTIGVNDTYGITGNPYCG